MFIGRLYTNIYQMNAKELFKFICVLSETDELQKEYKLTLMEFSKADDEYNLYKKNQTNAKKQSNKINGILADEIDKKVNLENSDIPLPS